MRLFIFFCSLIGPKLTTVENFTMKKTTILLGAVLLVGIAQVSISHMSQAQPAPMSYDRVLAMGKQDLSDKDYDNAEYEARELLVLARSSKQKSQALNLLGETLYRRKSYNEAREQWQAALELRGTGDDEAIHAIAQLGLARSYAAQDSYDEAIPHFKAVVDYFEQKKEANVATSLFSFALADAYYNTRQNNFAQNQINRVIAFSQDNPPLLMVAYTRAGQINFEQRKFEKARADYKQVLQQSEAANIPFTKLKVFATNQIVSMDTVKKIVGEGELPKNETYSVERATEFDSEGEPIRQRFY